MSNKSVINRYDRLQKTRYILILILVLLVVIAGIFDFLLGPDISISKLFEAIFNTNSANQDIKNALIVAEYIRLPQALMAIAVGLVLGLAGAEMQTVLNNPLASPFTLGLSSAAAFGAALAIVLNISIPGVPSTWIIATNAFLFSLLAVFLLDFLARYTKIQGTGIVLFGIALVFSFNALVSLMQFIATEDTLQGLVMWTMGNIARDPSYTKISIIYIVFIFVFIWAMSNAWKLTALRLGEDRAMSFGIDTKKLRLTTLIRISLSSAIAVAFVGPIGFIGLVAPHIARLTFGEDHKFYLPASAFFGALILSLASIVSKNLIPGVLIPVGIVTSLIGVPFFLAIVLKFKERVG